MQNLFKKYGRPGRNTGLIMKALKQIKENQPIAQ